LQLHYKSKGSFLIVREVTEQLLFTAETGPHVIVLRQGKLTPFKQREFLSLLAWIFDFQTCVCRLWDGHRYRRFNP
jgi:hypothetical protein